jgi:hypothetical protein
LDRCIDRRKNAGHILDDVVIPESQDTITRRGKIGSPVLIGSAIGMLPAIQFDNNPELMAGEVSEVRTDCRLTPKMMLLERRLSQMLPELLFSFGHVTPQSSRARHAVVG